jgi:hypothetical protein
MRHMADQTTPAAIAKRPGCPSRHHQERISHLFLAWQYRVYWSPHFTPNFDNKYRLFTLDLRQALPYYRSRRTMGKAQQRAKSTLADGDSAPASRSQSKGRPRPSSAGVFRIRCWLALAKPIWSVIMPMLYESVSSSTAIEKGNYARAQDEDPLWEG